MSKRSNIYLRRMLIHGACAVLFRVKYETSGFGQWVRRLSQRAARNKIVVAILPCAWFAPVRCRAVDNLVES